MIFLSALDVTHVESEILIIACEKQVEMTKQHIFDCLATFKKMCSKHPSGGDSICGNVILPISFMHLFIKQHHTSINCYIDVLKNTIAY